MISGNRDTELSEIQHESTNYFAINRRKRKKEQEKTVFVKPHEDGFCFVSAYTENGEIFIDHAEITVDSVGG
jgi:hypothetical protein